MTNESIRPTKTVVAYSNEVMEDADGSDGRAHEDHDHAAYVAALDRLLAQHEKGVSLECVELREAFKKRGHVPITQDNVAREAGRSRKALVPGGRFEKLGAHIKEMRSSHGVKLSTTAQLSEMRSELGEARQTIVVLRSKLAEAIVRVDRAETALSRANGLAERSSRQLGTRRPQ